MRKDASTKKKLKMVIVILVALIVLASAFVFFMFVSKSRENGSYDKHIKAAEEYINELEYDLAIAELEEAIKLDPKDETAYLLAADAYVGMGAVEAAVDILEYGAEEIGEDNLSEEYLEKMEEIDELVQSILYPPEVYEACEAFVDKMDELWDIQCDGMSFQDAIASIDKDEAYKWDVIVNPLEYDVSGYSGVGMKRKVIVFPSETEEEGYYVEDLAYVDQYSVVFCYYDEYPYDDYFEQVESFGPWAKAHGIYSVKDANDYFAFDTLNEDLLFEKYGYKINWCDDGSINFSYYKDGVNLYTWDFAQAYDQHSSFYFFIDVTDSRWYEMIPEGGEQGN